MFTHGDRTLAEVLNYCPLTHENSSEYLLFLLFEAYYHITTKCKTKEKIYWLNAFIWNIWDKIIFKKHGLHHSIRNEYKEGVCFEI